jgi:L-lactate dehydrogenase (cytochrome)
MPIYANYPVEFRQSVTRGIVADRVKLAERLTWDDVADLRDQWRGKLLVKGILHVDDARQAARLGADGIVVSSHGGRNLDSAAFPVDVLPQIAEAVGHELTVLADGGVQRGSDVVKLIGLGAKAVMLGRSVLYGLAVGGEGGASKVLKIIEDEMSRCLAFLGQPSIGALPADLILRQNCPDGA